MVGVYYTVQGGSHYVTIVPVIKSYGVVIQMKAAKQYFSCGSVYRKMQIFSL